MDLRARVAIDTGGTFTDLVASFSDGREPVRLKVPSTPDDPARATSDALTALEARVGAFELVELRHGTTVGTNALLERREAPGGLILTEGFEDTLRVRRQARPELYALHPVVPPPLIPPAHCFGIRGRLDPWGREVEALEDPTAWVQRHRAALAQLPALGICLLHAYANPQHERALGEALRRAFPDLHLTLSSELIPLPREYERTSTVAVNVYLGPVMGRYLRELHRVISPRPLWVMASAGGLASAERAAREPVHTVLSGPAGGVRGALETGRRAAHPRILGLDMGGTSTDVSLVLGELRPEEEGQLNEHALLVPRLPIETIGAGGGSIAYVDEAGALRVGPRSAGAVPGPAAYGRAGPEAEPTVTDANVVLGRLPQLLGGAMALDRQAAHQAVARLGEKLGTDVQSTALAIIRIAEAHMARACKRVSMERGVDPRTLTLLAFGGAGGLHACALAKELGCPAVLFPGEPGVLSAEGILHAPPQTVAVRALNLSEDQWNDAALGQHAQAVRQQAREALRHEGGAGGEVDVQLFFDCRYRGQSYPLAAEIAADEAITAQALRQAFDSLHRQRYGYALGAEVPVELVSARAFARSPSALPQAEVPAQARVVEGPCALPSYGSTLWVPEGWRAEAVADGGWLARPTAAHTQPRASTEEGAPPSPALPTALALEVHRQRLAAIAEEMGAALMRASFSANIKERRDFSCALFDAQGRMLAQAAHIPVHLGSQPLSVAAALAAMPMRPGLTIILNDPYAGGTHLPDVTLVRPVYAPGHTQPLFFVANRAHHADIGGISSGSMPSPVGPDGRPRALTIADEGWRSPPVELTDAVREHFAQTSRTPRERYGDLRAQEAANHVGEQRLLELMDALGHDVGALHHLNDALLDYTERRMRGILEDLPDGRYTFTDALDPPEPGAEPIPLPVVLTLHGGSATVDFTGAPDQVSSSLNAVRAITVSAVFYVFRCLGGEELPTNAGLMRPLTVLTRPGSLCDARPPAAVSAGNVETSQRLVDTLWGALAQAAPHRMPAASGGSMNNVLFGGVDPRPGPRQGETFAHYETLAGGAGGGPQGPGASAIHTHMTNTLNTPVEELERAYPVRIERYGVRRSAAAGGAPHRGGAGIVRHYHFLAPTQVTLVTERRRRAPWGLHGAAPGEPGRNVLRRRDGTETELGGQAEIQAEAGDHLIVETPGGGSWQPPGP